MMGLSDEKKWSDQFIPEIQSILGRYFFQVASFEEDLNRNTDLVLDLSNLNGGRIALRIRRLKFLKHGNEFTIRSAVLAGHKTELEKLLGGDGDYIFYGFGSDSGELVRWFIGDLVVFRRWYLEYMKDNGGRIPGNKRHNAEGSEFRVFAIADLPEDFIVAKDVVVAGVPPVPFAPGVGSRWKRT